MWSFLKALMPFIVFLVLASTNMKHVKIYISLTYHDLMLICCSYRKMLICLLSLLLFLIVMVPSDLLFQVAGIRFLWENIIQSIRKLKSGDKGLGCILAHTMGLGKTFQVLCSVCSKPMVSSFTPHSVPPLHPQLKQGCLVVCVNYVYVLVAFYRPC